MTVDVFLEPPAMTDRRFAASDADLLRRMRQRDEAALEALYQRYSPLVFTLALRIIGDRDLALEVMQDAFLRCWTGAERFDSTRGSAAAWLTGVTRNRAIDLLRGRQHHARQREQASLDSAGNEPITSDESEAIVDRDLVRSGLDQLPANQRQAIELAYFGGLTQAEIAGRLATPIGTIKSRIREGLDRLRTILLPVDSDGRHD